MLPEHIDATDVMDLARGWPAVLALASARATRSQTCLIGAHLHGFFADEIFRRIDRDVQKALCELALHEARGRRAGVSRASSADRTPSH